MFLPTYDTHECTVDKLDLVLKNLEKNPVTQIHDRSSCRKLARSLRENGFLFAHLSSDLSPSHSLPNGSL